MSFADDVRKMSTSAALTRYEAAHAEWMTWIDEYGPEVEADNWELYQLQDFWHQVWSKKLHGEEITDGFLWTHDVGPLVEVSA